MGKDKRQKQNVDIKAAEEVNDEEVDGVWGKLGEGAPNYKNVGWYVYSALPMLAHSWMVRLSEVHEATQDKPSIRPAQCRRSVCHESRY